jgi:hypothetical protein
MEREKDDCRINAEQISTMYVQVYDNPAISNEEMIFVLFTCCQRFSGLSWIGEELKRLH